MKTLALVSNCKECTHKHYFSAGIYECTKTRGELNSDWSIPAWCPLPDHPVAALETLQRERDEAVAALSELVACKDIKDKAEMLHFAGPLSSVGDEWKAEHDRLRADYIKRQPLAWTAARAAISTLTNQRKGEGNVE